eukprot:TRINITY_DN22944_c0_g5_i1.p1 TRINITY_DN22944_c0_g5~~TRINITY_DN22944_c0_g5_i1.p1  ORF type:complete len:122 (-),score=13.28 TRINITY_DN22944_c0_g5_i1:52-417(-)
MRRDGLFSIGRAHLGLRGRAANLQDVVVAARSVGVIVALRLRGPSERVWLLSIEATPYLHNRRASPEPVRRSWLLPPQGDGASTMEAGAGSSLRFFEVLLLLPPAEQAPVAHPLSIKGAMN